MQHRFSNSGLSVKLRRVLGRALVPVVALSAFVAAASPASAVLYNYTFSPGASLTFADGNTQLITGTFVFNGSFVTSASITLTGPSPEAGFYSNGCEGGHADAIFVCQGALGTQELVLVFQNGLAGQSDPMVTGRGGHVFSSNLSSQAITAVSGSAVPDTGVPEPSSLALLVGSAMGLLRLRRRKTAA